MAAELALEDGVQSLSLSDNAAPTPTGHASLPNGISSPSALSAQELAPHGEPAGKRPTPRFFPPLWLGRRTACLEVLKREGIRSVVDLGCGPGALLQILSSPANHLDDFPEIYPPSPVSESPSGVSHVPSPRERKLELLRSVPRQLNELHLRRLVGVDIRADSLRNAIEVSSPPVEKEGTKSSWGSTERERWEELTVEIYEGALEVFNEALEGVEAMVATEVIEHLTPQALAKFSSVILGVYQPRVVVVTTPNHEFNPYFVPSSSVDESVYRFPDPTHRTNRVFRDDDHQFEWTRAEFEAWAKEAAAEDDYSVTFSGVGSLSHYYGQGQPIPFPPPSLDAHPALVDSPASLALPSDPTHFFATQIATFRLRYPNESERSPRSHRPTPLPFFSPTSAPNAFLPPTGTPPLTTPPPSPSTSRSTSVSHTLLKSHLHRAHPSASNPAPATEILAALAKLFSGNFGSSRASLREIWGQSKVRILCGGAIGAVVEAVVEDESDEWDLEVDAMTTTWPRGAAQALATVTVTRPAKNVWLLSMHHNHANVLDNRLTPLVPALDDIELNFRRDFENGDKEASLVFTGERVKNKFFSNGLDLALVAECPGFFKDVYYALMERILTFPMHTVAALNGHTFAGGFCLSQVFDHRIMRAERAWCCMNELDFGAPLPAGMHAVLANRLPPTTLRRVMLSAHRFTAPEALAAGMIDEIVEGDGEAVIARGIEIAQAHAKYSRSGVLSMLKQTLFADVIKGLHIDEAIGNPADQNASKLAKLVAAAAQAKL